MSINRSNCVPGSRRIMWTALLGAFGILLSTAKIISAQSPVEIIRGRVLDSKGQPIAHVEVIATRAPDRRYLTAFTDSSGHFLIEWTERSGDYLVHFSVAGFEPARRRVTADPGQRELVILAYLVPKSTQELRPVTVTAARLYPSRETPLHPEPGALQTLKGGVTAALTGEDAGDLQKIALLVPGTSPNGNAVSFLGLPAEQNAITLNGMSAPVGAIPKDVQADVRVTTSSFDPSIGWFSGGATEVQVPAGWIISDHRAHWASQSAPDLRGGSRSPRLSVGTGGRGPLGVNDVWFYNAGASASAQRIGVSTFDDTDLGGFDRLGISPITADSLQAALAKTGLRLTPSATTGTSASASYVLRIDRAPYVRASGDAPRQALSFTTFGSARHDPLHGASPLVSVSHTNVDDQAALSGQVDYSTYYSSTGLLDVRSAVSTVIQRFDVRSALPEAQIQTATESSDPTHASPLFAVGGSGGRPETDHTWMWETSARARQFYGASHQVTVTVDSRFDGASVASPGASAGTFFYPSIAAMLANRPTQFNRHFGGARVSPTTWNVFLSIGDYWNPTPTVQLMYGLRGETNAVSTSLPVTTVTDTIFGVAPSFGRSMAHISPRVGFTWILADEDISALTNPMGHFWVPPKISVRGGIGEFRALVSPATLSTGSSRNGSQLDLQCTGDGVPVPDWQYWATDPGAIPTACIGSVGQTTMPNPTETYIDQRFAAARSYRTNLAISGATGPVNLSIEGVISLNLDQPNRTDLNFAGKEVFRSAIENRPVFVPAGDVDPTSGLLSPVSSRTNPAFANVLRIGSSDRGIAKQLTVTVSPSPHLRNHWTTSAAYTLLWADTRKNGFSATTGGNPMDIERIPSALSGQQQFRVQAGFFTSKRITGTMYLYATSGRRFTPLVSSDVNGDGYVNDRAFIFDATKVAEPAFRQQLIDLLSSARGSVGRCLRSQLDRIARPESCRGPWTASQTLQLSIPGGVLHLGDRAALNIDAVDPIPMIVGALSAGRRGAEWSTDAPPDPVLLYTTGFSTGPRQFRYAVNQHFGRPSAYGSSSRARLVVEMTFDMSRPFAEQQLDRALRPGRGAKGPSLTFDELKRGYSRSVPNAHSLLLEESDSLLLSRDQVDSLRMAETRLASRLDSAFARLARVLADLPYDYDAARMLALQESTLTEAARIAHDDALAIWPNVLTQIQKRLLGGKLAAYLDPTAPASRFRGRSPF